MAAEKSALTAIQQNEDMRRITAWVAIVAVPTAVTGFFGQNVPFPGFGETSGLRRLNADHRCFPLGSLHRLQTQELAVAAARGRDFSPGLGNTMARNMAARNMVATMIIRRRPRRLP